MTRRGNDGMPHRARGISRFVGALGAGRGRYHASVLTTIVLAATFAAPSFASAEEVYDSVTTHGGPVQTEPHVYEIYWGSKWSIEPYAAERTTFEKLYNDFSESAWQGILTQYWSPEGFVSSKLVVGAPYPDNSEPPAEVEATNMEAEVKKAIEAKKGLEGWPKELSDTTVNDQFVLLTPSGTIDNIDKEACGEHLPATKARYVYDIVPWEDETELENARNAFTRSSPPTSTPRLSPTQSKTAGGNGARKERSQTSVRTKARQVCLTG